jgi:hypothetical protein
MDVESLFRTSLNNCLRIFYTRFNLRKITEKVNNHWITTGIRIFWNHKQICRIAMTSNEKGMISNIVKYYQM